MMRFFRKFNELGMNGEKARQYDRYTREYRLAEIRRNARAVASQIQEGNAVLEVAPGPGYLAIELAKLGKNKLTGMDISRDCVEIARKNAREEGVDVEFREGNVSSMPFQDNTFDFIVCTLAFKNFKEPLKALREMYRVLRPGGRALLMEMNRNASEQARDAYIRDMNLQGMNAFFMKIAFGINRNGSYSRRQYEAMISRTGFRSFEIREEGIGISIRLNK